MKTIRFLAGILLITNGVLHIVEYLKIPNEPGSLGILIFGIIFMITGSLLFNRKLYPVYLGIIIPLIGMAMSIMKFGLPELFSLLALFKLLDLIVIGCCFYLLTRNKKLKSAPI